MTKVYVSKLTGGKCFGGEATLNFLLNGKVVHSENFSGMITGVHGGFYRNIKVGDFDTVEQVSALDVTFDWEFT